MADSDKDVRAAIAAEITAVASDSVVFPFLPLSSFENNLGEWPALLRSENDDGKVRAWVITRRRIETERMAGGGKKRRVTYTLLFFHWYDERDGGASEDSFSAELDAVGDALTSDTGLQVPLIDLGSFGTVQLHFAVCELTKTLC